MYFENVVNLGPYSAGYLDSKTCLSIIMLHLFLPDASLAFGYCRCLRVSVCLCVRPRVRQARVCPHNNLVTVQARITFFYFFLGGWGVGGGMIDRDL